MSGVAIIIVAAGSSSRMGKPKQLLPLGKTTLLGNAIKQAKASAAAEVFTVLGAGIEKIKPLIAHFDPTIVENPEWEQGIGSSIAKGIQYLKENRNYTGAFILLGDQPLINTSYLDKLIRKFTEDPTKLIATRYPHSNGVPALFPEKYFEKLAQLRGDEGAKFLLNSKETEVIAYDAGNKILDIDTPEDYRNIF